MLSPDSVISLVRPVCPDAPVPFIAMVVSSVLDDFCKRSMVWNTTLDPIHCVPGQVEYDLDPPYGSRVNILTSVMRDGAPFSMYDFNGVVLTLNVVPKGPYTLDVDAVLSPTPDATSLPDLLTPWIQDIAHGVTGRLMAMPQKPWSNQMAEYYLSQFNHAVNRVRLNANHKNSISSLRVSPRRFR
ncbi:hypothetical protein [Desulfovibrio inopinatus]|uniref:hypothetical protein n=1 Tax=Desulfovibrio inopinatus TaxID=102109 RepID=UPI000424CBDE|nr:hypothetical protein [Desulfovibrio inopinatus]